MTQRSLRWGGVSGSIAAFVRLWNADRGHSGGGCGLDAHLGVFKDEAVFGRYAEARRGGEERVGSGFGSRVVLGADKQREAVEQADRSERLDDRFAGAAGNHCKRDLAMLGHD